MILAFTDSNVIKAKGIATPDGSAAQFLNQLGLGSLFNSDAPESTIAPGLPGLVKKEDYNMVPEFRDEGNNITAAALPIILRVPPDLRVTTVTIPEHATVGQLFDLTYSVSNIGAGDTPATQDTWDDLFYLSRDQFLDLQSDRYLGGVEHTGGLQAGGSYVRTETREFACKRS